MRVVAAIVLSLPLLAGAQAVPKFAATRRVIAVEARLTNHRGDPLQGVEPSQLALAVDGLVCPRMTAEWIAAPAAAPPPSVAANRPSDSLTAPTPAIRSPVRVVLLVDFVNTAPADRVRLLRALRMLLAAPRPVADEIELEELMPPVEVLQDFTTNALALRSAVAGIKPLAGGHGPPPDFAYDPWLVRSGPLGDAARRQQVFFDHLRAAQTLAGFRALAATLALLRGRKVVVWLTADASALNPSFANQFSLDQPAEQPTGIPQAELRNTFRRLNAADIVIWPLQIRGVSNPRLVGAASAASAREACKLGGLQADRAGDARLAMFTMAEGTGGRVFEGSNDLVGLLRRALTLARGYYLLTCPFTLAAHVPHGHALRAGELLLAPGYHRIRVKVARRGVQVLARRGVLIAVR